MQIQIEIARPGEHLKIINWEQNILKTLNWEQEMRETHKINK